MDEIYCFSLFFQICFSRFWLVIIFKPIQSSEPSDSNSIIQLSKLILVVYLDGIFYLRDAQRLLYTFMCVKYYCDAFDLQYRNV